MPMSDYKKIAEKSTKDLVALVAEKREMLRKSRFGTTGSRDVKASRNAKKEIARALTALKAQSDDASTNAQ